MKVKKNPLYKLLESNPLWALPLVAIILLVGSWILPFVDLIYEGLWPFKEIVAWTILGLAGFVVVSQECCCIIETLAIVAIEAHKCFEKHQQHSLGSLAIQPNELEKLSEATYVGSFCRHCYDEQHTYPR
jgi:hypothetical protein